jgi:hypothetical protein
MSINALRGSMTGLVGGANAPATPLRGGHEQARIERQPGGATSPNATQAAQPQGAAVPTQPPAGTDPELWSVLSQDERAFFARLGAMGPLTYGRVLQSGVRPEQTVARGARLDVKA